ncbi:YfhO family protein, partial [Gammaproteobacteria bacterium]|nr:YfhO family protein [Gammaproteobacteria bacterium]
GIFIISNFIINYSNLSLIPVINNNYLKYIDTIFYIFVLFSFLYLSFRHDTLFIPGAEYHWSYYTGVIQGINNNGWLLWDTPSQYGFLNIIIASLFKSSSSWQSFYLFQGSLLFLVTTMIFFSLVKIMKLSFIYKILFFLIITLALYFADPAYIGPYPFPSSSVVRFFGIYAFIIVSLYYTVFSIKQALSFSLVLIIAFFWSAESALYTSSIYIFLLTAYLIRKNSFSNFLSVYKYYLALPLFFLFIGILFVSTYYKLNIGVYPDYLLFIEHAIGYAGGHGYVPFDLYGPGNILLLLYVGIFYIFLQYPLDDKKNNEYFSTIIIMLASIWAIASYYIGRPVPNNITAVIPILLLIILISNYIIDFKSFKYNHLSKIVSVCFIFILLAPILNTQFYKTLKNIDSGKINIQDKIYKSSKTIENLFLEIDIEEYNKLVFYGDSATQPIFSGDLSKFNNTNWLPIPLQLLENPISEERKAVLIDRYICRNKASQGLLLADVSSAILPRLNKFLINFSFYYTIKLVSADNKFRLYSFNNFNNINCKNNFD